MDENALPETVDVDPDSEPTERERLAARLQQWLDIPMAVLAVVWAALVAYDLVAPASQRDTLALAGNVIWGVFVAEFVVKVAVSGLPVRFVYRHWPSVLFLVLPALRLFRLVRAVRVLRVLPAARVIGSSYRAVGTARGLLQGRLAFLLFTTMIVAFGSGQLLFLLERGRGGGVSSLGEALWWSTNMAIANTMIFEPVTLAGRFLSITLSAFSVVVFASAAAALGAFFVESGEEREAAVSPEHPSPGEP